MSKKMKITKRYRLTFVNDNTLNTVWTLRLSRARLWGLSALCVAAIIALIFCILVWSPVSYLLPGYMRPDQRRTTVDNTLRVDSLLNVARQQQLYTANLFAILSDADPDSAAATAPVSEITDTLMTATEAERAFVESWLEKERGNLSVLTPVLAEGMMFRPPVIGGVMQPDGTTFRAGAGSTVVAIQDGTVIDVRLDASTGRQALTLQHSNDFISVYSGLVDCSAAAGRSVRAGQALGRLGSEGELTLSVWRQGSRADLTRLLPQ